ncbi:MAG: helix-turn-helix domain-containing protein [Nocardioides sp.]|nr:helix-turn-helix domain-containing protein [Nocardioides sp.]
MLVPAARRAIHTFGLADHRLLTSHEAALLLGVPVATLRTWRSRRRGYGPRAVQIGGSIRYRLADLLAWIDGHTENTDRHVPEGVEAPRRGKTSPADLPPSPGSEGQAARPVTAGSASTDQLPPADDGEGEQPVVGEQYCVGGGVLGQHAGDAAD